MHLKLVTSYTLRGINKEHDIRGTNFTLYLYNQYHNPLVLYLAIYRKKITKTF